MRPAIAMTIAGSDSIAGAGVQADLKTFAALGVYGVSAITAITAQSTTAVREVVQIEPRAVRSQIDEIARDVVLSAVKTGMLVTRDIVHTVADALESLGCRNIVVDPVMTATVTGARTLLAPNAVSIMKERLLPLAAVVTPNVSEAAELSGISVDSLGRAREAARRLAELGAAAIVIKGGHLTNGDAVDLLLWRGTFTEFAAPRAASGALHGTGCTFASAIAAGLALGDDIPAAVQRAKIYVTGAIEHALQVGHGARVLNHFWRQG